VREGLKRTFSAHWIKQATRQQARSVTETGKELGNRISLYLPLENIFLLFDMIFKLAIIFCYWSLCSDHVRLSFFEIG
jgi:hypothetical protein